MSNYDLDVLVIGGGFGGVYQLYNLRKAGFNVKLVEKGSDFGGTWYWNCYPGARVDSDTPIYQFSDRSAWEDWEWTEKFPGRDELVKYFDYMDKKWDLRKDSIFDKEVVAAHFKNDINKWNVTCHDGTEFTCRWLIAACGFAAKRYVPDFKGIDDFKGLWFHTGVWPQSGVDFKGKKVAVIGTGATGVQVIQEIGPVVEHLTVYQRTPNLAMPMQQRDLPRETQLEIKKDDDFQASFSRLRESFAGMTMNFVKQKCLDATEEQRTAFFEELFAKGGFHFWLGNYPDILIDQKANDIAYQFWAEKTRARISNPKKRDLLAPLKPPHPIGTKRPSLEQNYYEVVDQPNVEIVDISESPIQEITETGIRTSDGVVHVDIIVIATGFDAVSGSLMRVDVRGTDGVSLAERWKDGVESYLGLSIAHYPNLFYIYGPQGPTAFCNGPTCVELQGEWIVQTLRDMREAGVVRLDPSEDAQKIFSNKVDEIWNMALFPKTKSWYQGSNIPGKPIKALNWAGGVPAYIEEITNVQDDNYRGFIQVK